MKQKKPVIHKNRHLPISQWSTWRRRTWEILEVCAPGDRISQAVDTFIILLIFLNIAVLSLETVSSIHEKWHSEFFKFELFSVGIFTFEYVLRLWSCITNPKYSHWLRGRLRYLISPLAVFDFLAIFPFYLPFLGLDLRFARALRFFRLFRIAKLARYSESLQLFLAVAHKKKEELLTVVFLEAVLLLFSSCLLYYAENSAQPSVFSSIPASAWWAVATLSTVGYGDVYPITAVGQVIASFVIFLGIGLFTIPTGILAAGIIEEVNLGKSKLKSQSIQCPHCHHQINSKAD